MKKQIHVYYTGRVQGVGFRFTAQDLAKEKSVFGWAKNLRDGRVEIRAEAEEKVLKDFLESIKQYFSHYIQDIEAEWFEATEEFDDFSIRF